MLASHDLDIRGAGNLLGDEQSGHIKEVGIELYHQMLEEAVAAAKSTDDHGVLVEDQWTPQMDIGLPVLIPRRMCQTWGSTSALPPGSWSTRRGRN